MSVKQKHAWHCILFSARPSDRLAGGASSSCHLPRVFPVSGKLPGPGFQGQPFYIDGGRTTCVNVQMGSFIFLSCVFCFSKPWTLLSPPRSLRWGGTLASSLVRMG